MAAARVQCLQEEQHLYKLHQVHLYQLHLVCLCIILQSSAIGLIYTAVQQMNGLITDMHVWFSKIGYRPANSTHISIEQNTPDTGFIGVDLLGVLGLGLLDAHSVGVFSNSHPKHSNKCDIFMASNPYEQHWSGTEAPESSAAGTV